MADMLTVCIGNCSTGNENATYEGGFSMEMSEIATEVYNAYLYFLMLIGIPGNAMVLIVFSRHKPVTTTDWFILFITVCDFIALFINVPVYITLSTGVWDQYGNSLICVLHMFVSQSIVVSSSFIMCGLALDRYFKICRPMTSYSPNCARNICISISILTTLMSTPSIVMFESRTGSCRANHGLGLSIYYLVIFLTFIVAAIIVTFSYIKVNIRIKQTEAAIVKHKTSSFVGDRFNNKSLHSVKVNQIIPYDLNQEENNTESRRRDKGINDSQNVIALKCVGIKTTDTRNDVIEPSTSTGVSTVSGKISKLNQTTHNTLKSYRQASILTTKISFLVCGVFIFTWIPPWATFIVLIFSDKRYLNYDIIGFTKMTHLVNTITNPFLYIWFNRKFRKHLFDIFCCQKL